MSRLLYYTPLMRELFGSHNIVNKQGFVLAIDGNVIEQHFLSITQAFVLPNSSISDNDDDVV